MQNFVIVFCLLAAGLPGDNSLHFRICNGLILMCYHYIFLFYSSLCNFFLLDKSKFDESVGLTLLARVRSSEHPIIY